jgi:hypothetical protein
MADLSPAAQAVMDAANGASSWGPDDCLNDAREIAAAALRAAADLERQSPWYKRIEGCGARWMRDQILAIADELENQQ